MIEQTGESKSYTINYDSKRHDGCSFCSDRDRYAGDCLWDLEHRGNRIIMDAVALNYCPMCGRKLWGRK